MVDLRRRGRHAGAKATLGRELLRGQALEQDRERGAEYLVEAALEGHGSARLALAKAYLASRGLETANQQAALLWLDGVLESDSELAIETLHQLLIQAPSLKS